MLTHIFENLLGLSTSFAAMIFVFGLVIFIHEGGHFLVARWLGVRVEAFAFGFGPELWGVTRGDTRYSINAIPLGGYVKPAGESLEAHAGHPDEYFSKTWYQRLLIVYAGPGMNYILAFVVFFGLFWIVGRPVLGEIKPVIGKLVPDYPAAAAGLREGDRVLEVNGKALKTWDDLAGTIHELPGKQTALKVQRGDEVFTLTLVPKLEASRGIGLIGIQPKTPDEIDYVRQPVLTAMRMSAAYCLRISIDSFNTLSEAVLKAKRPDVAGPVGIIKTVHEVKKSGGMVDLIHLMGLISVAVGFFNLLPIPLLDGGHAVLFLWEGISRRPLTERLVRVTSSIGIVIILSILLFATYSDIARLSAERKAAADQAEPAPAK